MKALITKLALVTAVMLVLSGLIATATAQTIYSDDMNGTGSLYGSTPDIVDGNAIAPGTVGQTWITYGPGSGAGTLDTADWTRGVNPDAGGTPPDNSGTMATSSQDTAYLPFTPVSGDSYVLKATLTPAFNTGSTVDTLLGFVNTDTPNGGGGPNWGYADKDGVFSNDFGTGGTESFFAGGNTSVQSGPYTTGVHPSGFGNTYGNPLTVTISLLSTGPGTWSVSATGTDADTLATDFTTGTFALTTNDINYIGLFSTQNVTNVSDLSLNEVPTPVPEPTTWTLLGFGLFALVVIQRRRMAKSTSV